MTSRANETERPRWAGLRIAAWATAAALMAVPVVAELVSEEMAWDAFDFVFAAVMIFGTTFVFDLAARRAPNFFYLAGATIALGANFLLVWINLAVGIIGSEDDIGSTLLLGIPLIGLAGSLAARFRPAGLATTLVTMALVQVGIGAAALIAGWGAGSARWPYDIIVLSGFFTTAWLASAWLFMTAARKRRAAAPG